MFGHILLSFPGSVPAFFISMFLIIIGTGLLKPNVSSVVGDLYSPEDTRRDSGFSIFYMGINLGGFLAPIIVGTVGQTYNYHLGFSLAAIGMLFGLLTYLATRKKNLGSAGRTVPNPLTPAERKMVFGRIGIGILVIAAIFGYSIFMGWMTIELFTMIVSCLGILIPLIYFIVMFKSSKTTSDERSRLTAYIPLFVASMMFWAIQEQGANILATYADKRTHLEFLGVQLHSSWFQSLNPLFIVVLAPVFAWIWMRLETVSRQRRRSFHSG